MPACSSNQLERIQRYAHWQRVATGMHHLRYEERLQRRRLQADLITTFKILTSLLHIDPNLFSLPLARSGLRGHPFKVFQGASHRRRRESAFSVRVVKYCNKLPASVATAPSVNVFKKRLENVWTEVFTHLPIGWTLTNNPHSPNSPPPFSPACHPLTVSISICNPTPCFIYVVPSGPLWPTFYHYKA